MSARKRIITAVIFIFLILLQNIQSFAFSTPNIEEDEFDNRERPGVEERLGMQFGADRPSTKEDEPLDVDNNYRNYIDKLLSIYSLKNSDRFADRYEQNDVLEESDRFPSENELDSIFKSVSDDNREVVPSAISVKSIKTKPSQAEKKSTNFIDVSQLNKNDIKTVKQLIQKLKKNNTHKDSVTVSEDELDKVFGDDADDVNTVHQNMKTNFKNIVYKDDEPNSYSKNYNTLNSKKKRSTVESDEIITTGSDTRFITKILETVAKLRLKEKLENKEISYLADSLNSATDSQMKYSLSKVKHELNDLEKAILIEKALEYLGMEFSDTENKYLDLIAETYLRNLERSKNNHLSVGSAKNINSELSDSLQEDIGPNSWSLIQQNSDLEPNSEKDDIKFSSLARDKMLSEIESEDERDPENLITGANNEIIRKNDDIDDETSYENGLPKVNVRKRNQEDLVALKNYLRNNIISGLNEKLSANGKDLLRMVQPNRRRRLKESCPEIEILTDNCAMSDDIGIGVDDQAQELCARHQACYVCVGSLYSTPNQCDDAYRLEADKMCNGNEKCEISSRAFLHLSRHYHEVGQRVIDSCLAECVSDFIYGTYSFK